MILELVKQAVQIKMKCKFPSPIISEAEFCYASALLLRTMKREELLAEASAKKTISELRPLILPVVEQGMESLEGDAERKRLAKLLLSSRVEGEITEEIRTLFQ